MTALWLPPNHAELERKALEEAEKKVFEQHIDWLYHNTGYPKFPQGRTATTEGEGIAARYVEKTLTSYGFDVKMNMADAYLQIPLEGSVEILVPEKNVLPAVTRAFAPQTWPDGVEGQLFYAHGGLVSDYAGINIKGNIPLLEMGLPPIRRDKGLIATQQGAIGYVLMNSAGPIEKRSYWRGGEKAVWGNPTPEQVSELPRLPGVIICKADGEMLKGLISKGPVRARVTTKTNPRIWTKVRVPVASMPGKYEPEKYFLLSGHLDVWTGGTLCNGAGNSVMLELGRIISTCQGQLRRGVKIAYWNGHEDYGPYDGSTWWLDNNWNDVNKNCVAMRIIDTLGVRGPYRALVTYKELQSVTNDVVKEIMHEEADFPEYHGKFGSDMSFLGVGLPLFLERTMYKSGDPKAAAVSGDDSPLRWVGWQMHDPEDTPDKIDHDVVFSMLKVFLITTMRVCNSRVLPFDFKPVANDIQSALGRYQQDAKDNLDFTRAINNAKLFQERIASLEEGIQGMIDSESGTPDGSDALEKKLSSVNYCMMTLTRLYSPMFYTITGKYNQDNSTSLVTEPIPNLREVKILGDSKPSTDVHGTLKTKLTRKLNEVSDTLEMMNEIAAKATEGI